MMLHLTLKQTPLLAFGEGVALVAHGVASVARRKGKTMRAVEPHPVTGYQ